jgi:hypothetical protein
VSVDEASLVVLAVNVDDGLTVKVIASDVLAASVLEPPYAAVTACDPVVQNFVAKV